MTISHCKECGRAVGRMGGRGRQPMYCSAKCKQRNYRQKKAQVLAAKRKMLTFDEMELFKKLTSNGNDLSAVGFVYSLLNRLLRASWEEILLGMVAMQTARVNEAIGWKVDSE